MCCMLLFDLTRAIMTKSIIIKVKKTSNLSRTKIFTMSNDY